MRGPELVDGMSLLRTVVTEHVVEEERLLLPQLRERGAPEELAVLATRMRASKDAPT